MAIEHNITVEGPRWPAALHLTLLAALGYAGFGWLGWVFVLPPAATAPLWPAAGFALVMVLLHGRRMVVGLWLGAFGLAAAQGWVQGDPMVPVFAGLFATGAALQAVAGAWLCRRRLGEDWLLLEQEPDVLRLMLWGGLVGGLVAPTLWVGGLVLLGTLDPAAVPGAWLPRYAADVLGIWLFGPLSLCVLCGAVPLWQDRQRLVLLPMLLVLGVVSILYVDARRLQGQATAERLAEDGGAIARRVSDQLTRHREVLASIRNFAEVTPDFTLDQFERFTCPVLGENPDITALHYADVVSGVARVPDGTAGSRVLGLGDHPRGTLTAQGAGQLVVRYSVPRVGDRSVLGFDALAEPKLRRTIASALGRGDLAVTGPLQLLRERLPERGSDHGPDEDQASGGPGVVLAKFYPVHRHLGGSGGGRGHPNGFTVGVFHIPKMMELALRDALPPGLGIRLMDLSDPEGPLILYQSDRPRPDSGDLAGESVAWTGILPVADREWELGLIPAAGYARTPYPWLTSVVGAAGLLATVAFQVFLLGMTGRGAVLRRKNEEIQASRQGYLQLFNESPLPTWLYDASTLRFLMVNDRVVERYGWPRAALLEMGLAAIVPADQLRAYLQPPRQAAGTQPMEEYQHRTRSGAFITVRVSSSPTRYGETPARLEVIEDITERREVERVLMESERRFRRLFEDSPQAHVLLEDGRCVAANPAALSMFRMDRLEQIVGLRVADLSPPFQPDGQASDEKVIGLTRAAFQDGASVFEWAYGRADGEPFLARSLLTPIHQGGRELLHVVLIDVTEQQRAREQIEFLAFHDSLTRLPNRTLGQDRLQQDLVAAARHRTSLAVLYLDLDKFKYVNDTHGHLTGDRLLQGVAARLARGMGADGTLSRLASDEFMMVLPDLQPHHAVAQVAATCERILASLEEPFEFEGTRLFTSFSIGVAVYPEDGRDSQKLMVNADTALSKAKKAGHNTYRFFERQMNHDLMRFVQTREALRSAIEQQEFELHYQPQVDLRSGAVVGVEALLRWRRPGAAMVLPAEFIDVAEESGLVVPIGRWVLREACRQAAVWQAAGLNGLVVAVNLSAAQFRQAQLTQEVMAALADSGLNPAYLELELTESILLQEEGAVLDTVARWKAHGIRLSIDDFGTGYSSLAYLKRFKVDKLKIDRSFVTGLARDEEDRAIVQAVIQIARSLNLRTVAEGVEDATLADQLRVMGCDQGQGYLYARPLSAGALEQWLRDRAGTG